MKRAIIIGIIFLATAPIFAQVDESWSTKKQSAMNEYEKFKAQALKEYNDFRRQANEEYARFMEEAWKEYEVMAAEESP